MPKQLSVKEMIDTIKKQEQELEDVKDERAHLIENVKYEISKHRIEEHQFRTHHDALNAKLKTVKKTLEAIRMEAMNNESERGWKCIYCFGIDELCMKAITKLRGD